MTEPIKPQNKDSSTTTPGTFGTANSKKNAPKVGGSEIQSNNKKELLETATLKNIEDILKRAKDFEENAFSGDHSKKNTDIIQNLIGLKAILQEQGLNESLTLTIKRQEEKLVELEQEILKAASDAIKQNEKTQHLAKILTAALNFQKIEHSLGDDLLRLRLVDIKNRSNICQEAIELFDELSWLKNTDLKELEEVEKTKSDRAEEKLEQLIHLIQDAITSLDDTKKRLLDEGRIQSKKFKDLQEEALALNVAATEFHNEYDQLTKIVEETSRSFYTSPSDASLTFFDTALDNYKVLVEKIREKKITPIAPPAFLSPQVVISTITPPATRDEPKITDTLSIPSSPSTPKTTQGNPDELQKLKSTEFPGISGSDTEGYFITSREGEVTLLHNRRIVGTLYRYKGTIEDIEHAGKDFSKATELTNEILYSLQHTKMSKATEKARELGKALNALESETPVVPEIILETYYTYFSVRDNQKYKNKDFIKAEFLKNALEKAIQEGAITKDFTNADREAQLLGNEIRTITSPHIPVSPTTPPIAPTTPVTISTPDNNDPQNETPEEVGDLPSKNKYWGNIRVPTISLDKNTNEWKIKKGDTFEKMSELDLHHWLYIHDTLTAYRKLINTEDQADSFPTLVTMKNNILQALHEGDFAATKKEAELLSEEFDEKIKYSAANLEREEKEEREFNLNQLKDKSNYILDDNSVSFAFIKIPQNLAKSFLIINRTTGEWVPLERDDLTSVETAWSVLSNFKIRNSTPPGCIEKKNEIISLINDYQFEAAGKAAQEYIDEFSALTRRPKLSVLSPLPPLRPTVSLSTPSPAIATSNLAKSVALHQVLLTKTDELLKKNLQNLTPLQVQTFQSISAETAALEKKARDTPTNHTAALFEAMVKGYSEELDKKINFFKATTITLPPGTKVMRSKRLRGNMPQIETIEEWQARQKANTTPKTDLEETIALRNNTEIRLKHQEMFERDPELYKRIYGAHNPVEDIVTREIANRTPQEFLIVLALEKEELLRKKIDFMTNKETTQPEDFTNGIAEFDQELHELGEKIKKYTDISITPYQKISTPSETTTHLTATEVYSPLHEVADDTQPQQSGRNFQVNENEQPVKEDGSLFSSAELDQHPQVMIPLNESLQGGMVPLQREESAHHAKNNEHPKVEPITTPISAPRPTPRISPENEEEKKKRFTYIQKLATTLFTFPSIKKKPWGWIAAGMTAFALGGASSVFAGDKKEVAGSDQRLRTLGEVAMKDLEWQRVAQAKVSPVFLADFTGSQKIPFEKFLEVHVPSFGISVSNPAAKDKLSNLSCRNIYNIPGAHAGLSATQQKECSILVKNLVEIMISAQASMNVLYKEGDDIFGGMTVQEMYTATQAAVAKADMTRDRLIKTI